MSKAVVENNRETCTGSSSQLSDATFESEVKSSPLCRDTLKDGRAFNHSQIRDSETDPVAALGQEILKRINCVQSPKSISTEDHPSKLNESSPACIAKTVEDVAEVNRCPMPHLTVEVLSEPSNSFQNNLDRIIDPVLHTLLKESKSAINAVLDEPINITDDESVDDPHICVICHENFDDSMHLDTHMEIHHNKILPEHSYSCDKCDSKFKESCSLESHRKVHSDHCTSKSRDKRYRARSWS